MGIFVGISLPPKTFFATMEGIGANTPRLHGFHRLLPRLWELFYAPSGWGPGAAGTAICPVGTQQAAAKLLAGPPRGSESRWPVPSATRIRESCGCTQRCHRFLGGGRKIGITPIFSSPYRSYSTGTDSAPDIYPHASVRNRAACCAVIAPGRRTPRQHAWGKR
jgi:hypothetical protein